MSSGKAAITNATWQNARAVPQYTGNPIYLGDGNGNFAVPGFASQRLVYFYEYTTAGIRSVSSAPLWTGSGIQYTATLPTVAPIEAWLGLPPNSDKISIMGQTPSGVNTTGGMTLEQQSLNQAAFPASPNTQEFRAAPSPISGLNEAQVNPGTYTDPSTGARAAYAGETTGDIQTAITALAGSGNGQIAWITFDDATGKTHVETNAAVAPAGSLPQRAQFSDATIMAISTTYKKNIPVYLYDGQTLAEADFYRRLDSRYAMFPGSSSVALYYQTVQVNGSAQTQRAALDLIAGTNITLTPVDDSGGNRTKVTIDASGGGGSGQPTNILINGGFDLAQRTDPTTLTTIATDTYGPDRWRCCTQNADLQYQRLDAASEAGLTSMWMGNFKKITSAGKVFIFQPIEGENSVPLRSRTMTFQIMLKTDSARTFRLGIIELNSSGTINAIPATTITSWNANGTDPTLGTNLAYVGTPVSCSVTTSESLFSVTATLPGNSKNYAVAYWSDSQLPANATYTPAQAQLVDGSSTVAWLPDPFEDTYARCQRYCEKSTDPDEPASGSLSSGYVDMIWGAAFTTEMRTTINMKVTKFASPTVSLWDTNGNGGSASPKVFRSGAGNQAASIPVIGQQCFSVSCTAVVSSNELAFSWLAEAEL